MTPVSSPERVLARLRAEILAGAFDDASRLSEPMLSRRFGVSRGTVREALRQLAAEGLVVIAAGRGASVVRPTADDIEEIFSIRGATPSRSAARSPAATPPGRSGACGNTWCTPSMRSFASWPAPR